jgi:hypothetical protein
VGKQVRRTALAFQPETVARHLLVRIGIPPLRQAQGRDFRKEHLDPLDPGVYDVSVTVNDLIAHRSISRTSRLEVK